MKAYLLSVLDAWAWVSGNPNYSNALSLYP